MRKPGEPSADWVPPDYGKQSLSHSNTGPMGEAGDTRVGVIKLHKVLEETAGKTGWKKTRKGWFCPYCAKRTGVSG